MAGFYDYAKGVYSEAVAAGNGELLDLQNKARSLRLAADSMLWRKNELAKMAPEFKKDPKAYAVYQAHMQRGTALQQTISNVLAKVDGIITAARSAGMSLNELGAVPIIAAALVAGLLGTIATVAYAIHAYEQSTAALIDKGKTYSAAINSGRMTPQQAIDLENASQGKGGMDTRKYFAVGGVAMLIALIVWKFKK
jgi:hypothetical protein